MTLHAQAQTLRDLYAAPEILRVVNVWDAVSATVVAGVPGMTAIATAGHGIAASLGYPDGEHIPVAEMLFMTGRITASVSLPVTADLDAGFGDPGDTVRRAIALGVVGANVEDRLLPLEAATKRMQEVVSAAAAAGLPNFCLNARTDVFVRGGERPLDVVIDDAIARGNAYLDAGAVCVFVPGVLNAEVTERLVAGIGRGKISVIGLPGALTAAEYEALGVARISYGPMPQNVSLSALKRLTETLGKNGAIPEETELLNNL